MRRLALLAACAALSVLLATGGVSAQTAGAAPGLPTNLSATAVGGSLTVTWSAPTADGGATITSYDLGNTSGATPATRPTPTGPYWTTCGPRARSRTSFPDSRKAPGTPCRCGPSTATGMGAGRTPSPRRPPTTATRKATATPAALGDDLPGTIDTFGRRGLLLLHHRRHDRHDGCLVVHHWRYRHSRLPLQLERDDASWPRITTAAARTTT